jgi:hypothetical protein
MILRRSVGSDSHSSMHTDLLAQGAHVVLAKSPECGQARVGEPHLLGGAQPECPLDLRRRHEPTLEVRDLTQVS